MTDVITKVAIGWVEYPFAGWGSEWQEVVYLTQAEYDALPASKLTDGKIYKIKTSGVAPTPGGGTAIERGDMLLAKITWSSENETYYCWYEQYKTYILRNNWTMYKSLEFTSYGWIEWTFLNNMYLCRSNGSETTDQVKIMNLSNDEVLTFTPWRSFKLKDNYLHTSNLKFNLLNWEYVEWSNPEYESIPSWLYYKGLYYTQDSNDYVASDVNGTEVKRYSNVWTINGIANGKLYRNVGDVAYAIATI